MTKEILFQQDPQYFDFGTPLGKDLYGIRPDLIKIAKGLASSYLQLFRVIMGERIWKVNEQGSEEFGPMGHGWTYSEHTLGTAAGLANLDILEWESLTENACDTGIYLPQQFYEAFDNNP